MDTTAVPDPGVRHRVAHARTGAALARMGTALTLIGATLALGACARKESPSGGPPDLDAPTLVSSTPDSGASGVPVDVRPTLTFSEGMEPRSTGDAVSIAPPVEIRQRRWSKHTLTLVFGDTLRRDATTSTR
jgi:hypothetical protein